MGDRILVIHGAGLQLRGKVDIALFGPMTMDDYTAQIRLFAQQLGVDVEVFHSLEVPEVVEKIRGCKAEGAGGLLINPGGFTVGPAEIGAAIKECGLPSVEVHLSNPAARSVVSHIAPSTTGVVTGFGIHGYFLGLAGLLDKISQTPRNA